MVDQQRLAAEGQRAPEEDGPGPGRHDDGPRGHVEVHPAVLLAVDRVHHRLRGGRARGRLAAETQAGNDRDRGAQGAGRHRAFRPQEAQELAAVASCGRLLQQPALLVGDHLRARRVGAGGDRDLDRDALAARAGHQLHAKGVLTGDGGDGDRDEGARDALREVERSAPAVEDRVGGAEAPTRGEPNDQDAAREGPTLVDRERYLSHALDHVLGGPGGGGQDGDQEGPDGRARRPAHSAVRGVAPARMRTAAAMAAPSSG